MHGHLIRIELASPGKDPAEPLIRELVKDVTPNELHRYEVDRYFRRYVDGFSPGGFEFGGDLFFRGSHEHDLVNGQFPINNYDAEFTAAGLLSTTGQIMRFRASGSKTSLAPSSPSQIAYAMGRLMTYHASAFINPHGAISEVDIGLKQIGNVFGHPAGRRAFFNETLQPTVGTGTMNPAGPLVFGPKDEGHYLFDVRIAKTGDDTGAAIVYRRRPYFHGAYEAGAGAGDYLVSASGDTLATRFTGSRVRYDLSTIIPDNAAPLPSTVPYSSNYPTATSKTNNLRAFASGLAFDGLEGGRVWWSVVDSLASNNANASSSRSIWAWKRFSPEAPLRMDLTLTDYPVLASGVQFRDLKAGRGGLVYVAADANDNAGNGSNSGGALLIIDAATDTVIDVLGASVDAVHTVGGLLSDNVLAIAVDTSETRASAGHDRVWLLSRSGLSYFDVDISAHTLGAISTVAAVGATHNTIDAGSIRGLGSFTMQGASSGAQNGCQPLMTHDSAGNVYWVSAPGTSGIQRLNKLVGDASAHTFYSLDTSAEGGALGFIDIGTGDSGLGAASRRQLAALRCHRRSSADAFGDDLWIGAGKGNASSSVLVRQIPVSSWSSGNNPGFGYPADDFTTDASFEHEWHLSVSQDGSVFVASSRQTAAMLESLGRKALSSATGATKTISGGPSSWTLTDTAANFPTDVVGRPLWIKHATTPANDNRYVITGRTSSTAITFAGTGLTAEGPEALDWAIDYFDSDGGSGQGSASWASDIHFAMSSSVFPDDSGIAFFFYPRNGTIQPHYLHHHLPLSFQWQASATTFQTSAGATAARGPATNQVTLTADTFNADVEPGDYFQITSGAHTGVSIQVLTRDGDGQVTLIGDAPSFGPESWVILRQKWYPSRFPSYAVASSKTVTTAAELLGLGARVAFANGAGPQQFVAGEYYTFGATIGIFKDATQQLTFSYDLYTEKTDLITADAATLKTCVDGTALGGYVNSTNQSNVLTDNPFTGTGRPSGGAQLQLGHYQRRLILNGSNNSQDTTVSCTFSTSHGLQLALDLGSDQIASTLRFAFESISMPSALLRNLQIDLYSATNAAGPASWTHRATYLSTSDEPAWNLNADTTHDQTASSFLTGSNAEIEVDLNALLGIGNVAERYWKMYISVASGTNTNTMRMIGMMALDGSGVPIGITANKYLSASLDSNYLANYPVRVVFLQQTSAGASASRSSSAQDTIDLTADTFNTVSPTDVAINDFFRLVRNSGGGATKSIGDPDPNTGLVVVTDSAGAFKDVYAGGTFSASGATHPGNDGVFPVISITDATHLVIFNPDAVAEGPDSLSYTLRSPDLKITAVNSTTEIVVGSSVPYFASEAWEVVRNADVRPRDDEGGGENQARFPQTAGEIFLCPVTGHLFYHATDVSNSRSVRVEKYVKVKRSL